MSLKEMSLKEIRDSFIRRSKEQMSNEEMHPVLINPELLQIGEQKFVFLIVNPNMDDREEVEKLVRQSIIEDFGFIIVFEEEPDEFANFLITTLAKMTTVIPAYPLHFLLYNKELDDFSYLNMEVNVEEDEDDV